MLLLSSADFFQKKFFSKTLSGTLSDIESNSLDPEQDRHFVGPDLDSNCLKRLSTETKVTASKEGV